MFGEYKVQMRNKLLGIQGLKTRGEWGRFYWKEGVCEAGTWPQAVENPKHSGNNYMDLDFLSSYGIGGGRGGRGKRGEG